MVTTRTGTNIYCALDLYHHSEKGPHDPGAGMLIAHFSEGKTDSERLRISPRVTQLITGKTRREPCSGKLGGTSCLLHGRGWKRDWGRELLGVV